MGHRRDGAVSACVKIVYQTSLPGIVTMSLSIGPVSNMSRMQQWHASLLAIKSGREEPPIQRNSRLRHHVLILSWGYLK